MAGEHIYPDETPLIRIGNETNHEFTERELDILKELTTGKTNVEISEKLFISVKVKTCFGVFQSITSEYGQCPNTNIN